MTIPENDYRQMARALEVDSDRLIARQHGLYGRHGFESRGDSANSRQAAIVKHLQKPVREIGEFRLAEISPLCAYLWRSF